MNQVHPAESLQLREVAILLRRVSDRQRHIGLLHKDNDTGEVVLFHLAFHLELRCESPPTNGLWVDPTYPTPRLRQVAAICRHVWAKNGQRIPFGISRPNDCFDHDTYEFLIQPSRHGLTCATFVLAMFLEAGLEIVEYDGWPSRPDDAVWQESVLSQLQERRASSEHIACVKGGVGGIRIRPEEVAGAATLTPHPANYDRTKPAAEEILRLLNLTA